MRPEVRRPERLDARRVAVYRKMSSDERLAAAFDATRLVRSRLEAISVRARGGLPSR